MQAQNTVSSTQTWRQVSDNTLLKELIQQLNLLRGCAVNSAVNSVSTMAATCGSNVSEYFRDKNMCMNNNM